MKTSKYLQEKFEAQETILKGEIISEIKNICETDKTYKLINQDYPSHKYSVICENDQVSYEDMSNKDVSVLHLNLMTINELLSIHGQIEAENERSKQNLHNFAQDLVKRTEINMFKNHFEEATNHYLDNSETEDVMEITLSVKGKSLNIHNSPEVYNAMMELLEAAIQVETELNS
jgi:hypothetical protein